MTTPAELRSTRELLGLTHGEIARKLGVSERTIIAWERGDRTTPEGLADDLTTLTQAFDQLIDRMVSEDGPIEVPERGTLGGWPARTWRHAAALARAERPTPVVYPDGLSYWETKAAQHWRRIGGAPDQWHALAEWAEAHHGDETGAVLITKAGQIVGEAERITTNVGQMYVITPATRDRWRLDKTVLDLGVAELSRKAGEPVVMVKSWEVTKGA